MAFKKTFSAADIKLLTGFVKHPTVTKLLRLKVRRSGPIQEVKACEFLLERLNSAAVRYEISKSFSQPKPLTIQKRNLKTVEAGARKLKALIGSDRPGLGPSVRSLLACSMDDEAAKHGEYSFALKISRAGERNIHEDGFAFGRVNDALALLASAAAEAQRTATAGVIKGKGGDRRCKDVALSSLFVEFIEIYETAFDKAAGASTGGKSTPSGPCLRFCSFAAKKILGRALTEHSVRERIQKAKVAIQSRKAH